MSDHTDHGLLETLKTIARVLNHDAVKPNTAEAHARNMAQGVVAAAEVGDPSTEPPKLVVDEAREIGDGESLDRATGIFVRALGPEGRWGSFDIVELDKASLLTWLRSRGGYNPWAENTVALLLGHAALGRAGPTIANNPSKRKIQL